MKFGVGLPNYGRGKTFDDVRRVAVSAEDLGYDSIWTTDHLLVPRADSESYGNVFESIVTLAMLSSLTKRVTLGTSVLVLPQRNPILAAKQIATLDAATNGRVIVALGVGWNAGEYENLGANFHNRGKRLDESIALLRALWSHEQVSFRGKYTQLEDGVFSPRPARPIPIWIGGNTEPAIRRAAKLGDGWHASGVSSEQLASGLKQISELNPGRKLVVSARISIDMRAGVSPTFQYHGSQRFRFVGTSDAVRARLREYKGAGLEHLTLSFPMEDVGEMLAQMERFAREIMPEFQE